MDSLQYWLFNIKGYKNLSKKGEKETVELTAVLFRNYLPYAKGVIIDRALPAIDGLKPSQRRTLYTMYKMKLLKGDKTKSTNIVGSTMRLHPHGDATIYDTLVRMSSGNETLNVPYIESKGNFGKVYSDDLAYAASRYTEAKLSPICAEIFDGIDEDAVEFKPNYDDSTTEPELLPVKFPTILANSSRGIAVGTGSRIPSFGLKNVCQAVIGLCDNSIKDITDLVNTLGIPEFTTGGNVHTTREDMIELAKSGHGTITMTGSALTYSDRIEIIEIPYSTSVEAIIDAINEGIKAGTMKEISEVRDDMDLKNGLKITVHLRRNASPQAVLRKLVALTPFCSTVSFNTRFILDDRCETMGLMELLQCWIKFRMDTVKRIYSYRLNKLTERVEILETWEKIKDQLEQVITVIRSGSDDEAKSALISKFGLSEKQAEYLLDMKIRSITKNNVTKYLNELDSTKKSAAYAAKVVADDTEKKKIIIDDQKRIISNYVKSDNRTHIAPPITPEDKEKPAVVIDNEPVTVVVTKKYGVKRLSSLRDLSGFEVGDGDEEMLRLPTKNSEHIMIFTYSGTVYKVLVNDIDTGRGKIKDNLADMVGISPKEIMFVDASGDYSKHFNVVYKNGRGYRVQYSQAQGKRSKYRSLFDAAEPGELWWTFSDKFFMITRRRKASYCDLSLLGLHNTRAAFKVARVDSGDAIFGLQDAANVPDMDSLDMTKYNKEYTVSIGEDELWPGAREKYLRDLEEREKAREAAKEAARIAKEQAKIARREARRKAKRG